MKENFVPIYYIHINNIINYVEESDKETDKEEKEENNILTNNYIHDYLE